MFSFFIIIASFSGILSSIITPIGLGICIKNFKGFSFQKNTLSDCAKLDKYGKLFDYNLALFGILEFLFSFAILHKFSLLDKPGLVISLITAWLMTILAAIFPINRYKRIHTLFGYTIFIILIPWTIGLHIYLLRINLLIGSIGSILSMIIGVGTIGLYLKYRECSIPEIYFIFFVIIWNLFFSYVLFFY